MKVKKLSITDSDYPLTLKEMSSPPKQLFYIGAEPSEWLKRPRVAIVGTRNITAYGRRVATEFAEELARRNISIVSGLAIGTDSVAHQAAVSVGGVHLAVLAGGLDRIYPASNTNLAKQLLVRGGAILSEYPEGTPTFKQNLVARNRIVSGLADALLIVEASERSGTLHTARFALEQGKDVLVIPGNITSPESVGCNNLIKSGAQPVTSVADVLFALGADNLVETTTVHIGSNAEEQMLLDLLYNGVTDVNELLSASSQEPTTFTETLTMLELSGKIRPLGNNHWAPF